MASLNHSLTHVYEFYGTSRSNRDLKIWLHIETGENWAKIRKTQQLAFQASQKKFEYQDWATADLFEAGFPLNATPNRAENTPKRHLVRHNRFPDIELQLTLFRHIMKK